MHILKFITCYLIVSFLANISLYAQERINFTLIKSKPVISVNINGKTGYFLIDSGSDLTLIHKNEHKKFKFQYFERTDHYQANSLGNSDLVLFNATGVKMLIGNSRIKTFFYAFDLSRVIETLFLNSGIKISGIIGADILDSYGFVIDYAEKQILIKNADKKKHPKATNDTFILDTEFEKNPQSCTVF